jgi:hypothetical protein
MIYVHEDSNNGGYYFSNGGDLQTPSYTLKETVIKIRFIKDLGLNINYELSGINWDDYIN